MRVAPEDERTNPRNILLIGLIVMIIGAGIYVYLITRPPSVTLMMKDPPAPAYPSDITNIWVTFSAMQIHQIRSDGDSWINLNSSTTVTVDLIAIITTPRNLGVFSIDPGNYTEMRFMVSTAMAKRSGQDVSLTIDITLRTYVLARFPSQLILSNGQSATITVDVRADEAFLSVNQFRADITATFTR